MQTTVPFSLRGCAAAALLALAGAGAQAALVNGGFETGDLTGWTTSGDTTYIGVASGIGRSGDYGAFFGPDPLGSIAQTLATTAGTRYEVAFWLSLDDSATPNLFSWSWNGVEQALAADTGAFGYTRYSAFVTAADSLSELSFSFANPQSFFLLDDVSVSASASAVPEPATAALVALGLAYLVARRRPRAR